MRSLLAALPILGLLFLSPHRGIAQNAPPGSDQNLVDQALKLIGEGKSGQAITSLEPLDAKQPEPAGVEAALGKAYYHKRDYQNAAAHLETALKQNPNDAESTQLLGLSYYLLGHVKQAVPLLEKVQSWLPRPDVTASYLLGVSFLDTRQYDKARVAFAKMFSVPPESAQAHLVLGQMMVRFEFEDQAAVELTRALAIDPRLPMVHFLLGEIDLFKSQIEPALTEFQAELGIDPVLWLAYWRLGDAYTRIEKWDEAERALKQAIWLNQNFTGPYILLGKVEMKKGDPALAAEFLQKALKMDPNNYLAHYILATAYKQLGRTADANREFGLTESLRSQSQP